MLNRIEKLVLDGVDEITWLELSFDEEHGETLTIEVGAYHEWFHARVERQGLGRYAIKLIKRWETPQNDYNLH